MKKLALAAVLLFSSAMVYAEGGNLGYGDRGAFAWQALWHSSVTAAIAGNTTVIATGPCIVGYVQVLSTGSSAWNLVALSTSGNNAAFTYTYISSFSPVNIPAINPSDTGLFVNWVSSNGFGLSNSQFNPSAPSTIRILWSYIQSYELYPWGNPR